MNSSFRGGGHYSTSLSLTLGERFPERHRFHRCVPPPELSVTLGIIGRRFDVDQTADAHERFKLSSDKRSAAWRRPFLQVRDPHPLAIKKVVPDDSSSSFCRLLSGLETSMSTCFPRGRHCFASSSLIFGEPFSERHNPWATAMA